MTGFDDLTLATAVEPELTTVRLPAEQVGEQGMAALLAVLDGGTPPDDTLPVELVGPGLHGRPPPASRCTHRAPRRRPRRRAPAPGPLPEPGAPPARPRGTGPAPDSAPALVVGPPSVGADAPSSSSRRAS